MFSSRLKLLPSMVLILLFLVLAYLNWPCLAPFSIDLSRETTLPGRLLRGDRLFIDVRYLYGPLSPTLLKHLIGAFGDQLFTYYAYACSLSALILFFLFKTSQFFLSQLASFTVTAFFLVTYMFQGPIWGGFVLPYSYAFLLSVALTLATLYLLVFNLARSEAPGRYFRYGLALFCSGLLAVTKLEFFLYTFPLIGLSLFFELKRVRWEARALGRLAFGLLLVAAPSLAWALGFHFAGGTRQQFIDSYLHSSFVNLMQWMPYRYYFYAPSVGIFTKWMVWAVLFGLLFFKKVRWAPYFLLLFSLILLGSQTLPEDHRLVRLLPPPHFFYLFVIATITVNSFFRLFRRGRPFQLTAEALLDWAIVLVPLREFIQMGVPFRLIPNFATSIYMLPVYYLAAARVLGRLLGHSQQGYRLGLAVSYAAVAILAFGYPVFTHIRKTEELRRDTVITERGPDRFRAARNSLELEVIDYINGHLSENDRLLSIQSDFVHRYTAHRNLTGFEHIVNNLLTEDEERETIALVENKKINYVLLGVFNVNHLVTGKESLVHLVNHIRSNFEVVKSFGDIDVFLNPMNYNLYSVMKEGGFVLLRKRQGI